jgi:ribonuclease VapC
VAVLDASALLAYAYTETGHEVVAEHLRDGVVSAVNWSEVLQKITINGGDADRLGDWILALGLQVIPFDSTDAREVAALYPDTRQHGLSQADRACLVLAARLGSPAVTADQAWRDLTIDAKVQLIR